MRNFTRSLLLGALAVGVSGALFAQTASVSLSMDSGGLILTNKGGVTPLSAGSDAAGDGFALQLGYFSGATVANPFEGVWTPFAGSGTALFSNLSIGDEVGSGAGAGEFAFSINFTGGTAGLPNAGQIIAIRYFDATSVAGSAFFGVASSADWTWKAPKFPADAMAFSLADPTVVWFGGNVATTGTAVIPEPSTYAIILGGLTLGLVIVRRRLKK